MYSLTVRVRVTAPRSMDEMERRTQQARRCYRRRGESVFAGMRSAWHCVRRAVGLADYRWARLDKFWLHQALKFDFTADLSLTDTGNRSEEVIK